ncbi:GLUT4 regulating protein TUG-domain-containing protein [Xylaria bambusicola]|uniref:GLUT4 regulating protein TUG-domain-containing protein n=1 Tax=Xylaria bambusicola TaxID=326684 RepID=UPI002007E266|nr:GLUT4 regulating protein TUG-domain-containing protein [Xylaria bambusicola]KAI0515262.1 GLUT4 regulating protein TUG-domain-containing protein [Xylaria bambusicola]
MATNVKVVGTDLRQVTIKVNPGTYLTEVLEQACTKLKIPNNKYLLKHKQRQLDLSQTFRTSGLIPGARLELVVRANTPSAVNVALQLPPPESSLFPPHGRVSEKLPSDFTIWQILRQFESGKASAGKNVNITARAVPQTNNGTQAGSGQLYYEMPNIVIENRTLSTFVDFQKTLAQLGYNSGGVLIRLSFQKTTQSLTDAMREIEEYFKSQEQESTPQKIQGADTKEMEGTSGSRSEPPAPASEAPATPKSTEVVSPPVSNQEPASIQDNAVNDSMDIDEQSGQRPVTIFSAPTSSTPIAASRLDSEEDYAPGISHAKAHQKMLKSLGENKRLLSDQELEEKAAIEEAKVAAIKSIKIKVRFPDNFSAEWTFGPADTGASLYSEVRDIMANNSPSFKLVLPGTRTIIKDDGESKLIKGYRLNTNTLVNFLWDDSVAADVRRQPFLKSSVAGQAQQVVVPDVPEVEVKEDGQSVPVQAPKPKNDGDGSGFKKPKWLKGFGKK